jgi:hypothetical protein
MVMVRPLQQKSVKPTGELKPGQVIGQTFTSHEENLRGVSLLFGTYGKLWKGKLVFHLQEANDIGSNKDIVTLVSDSASVPDNLWKIFNFPTIFQSNGKKYYVYIEVPKADPGQRLVLWSDPNGSYSEGSAYVNHHEISSDLAICLYYVKP